jgi:hypothetical protein
MKKIQTHDDKGPKLRRDWKGARVRLRRELQNGSHVYPQGMLATVYDCCPYATLITDPCPHCGVRCYIRMVSWECLDYVSPVRVD